MIVNQLSTTSNSQNSSQQQQQHITNSINLTPQYAGGSTTMHVSNQNQQQNSQNFLFQTSSAMQPQQAQLYHYQLLKTPPPSLATLSNSPTTLAYQTHQYANIMPSDQTNFLSQAINFTAKQFDNNNQCSLTTSFTSEHQIYEYMHQLLEEKEKLKELYNEPYSYLLPISAKLLDEGKINLIYYFNFIKLKYEKGIKIRGQLYLCVCVCVC